MTTLKAKLEELKAIEEARRAAIDNQREAMEREFPVGMVVRVAVGGKPFTAQITGYESPMLASAVGYLVGANVKTLRRRRFSYHDIIDIVDAGD